MVDFSPECRAYHGAKGGQVKGQILKSNLNMVTDVEGDQVPGTRITKNDHF